MSPPKGGLFGFWARSAFKKHGLIHGSEDLDRADLDSEDLDSEDLDSEDLGSEDLGSEDVTLVQPSIRPTPPVAPTHCGARAYKGSFPSHGRQNGRKDRKCSQRCQAASTRLR